MAVESERYLFTVEDYHRMVDAGILTEDSRVELIEGNVVPMSPIHGPQMRCVGTITHLLVESVGRNAFVSVGGSVRLDEYSEPQPDIAVLRRPPEGREPPGVAEILLLTEVSDSTLVTDLNLKARLYARAAVPEYWVAAIGDQEIIQHTDPRDGVYRMVRRFRLGERVQSVLPPAVDLAVDDIFS